MFEIKYHSKVLEDIIKIDKTILVLIKKSIEKKLSSNPEKFGKPLRNTLRNLYSLRIGGYSVIYQIQNKKLTVLIIMIKNRDTVYLDALKRINKSNLNHEYKRINKTRFRRRSRQN